MRNEVEHQQRKTGYKRRVRKMEVLSITDMKTSLIWKRVPAHCIGDEFFGRIYAHHMPTALALRDLESQGTNTRTYIEHDSGIRHTCEIHQQWSYDTAPTAHESVISFGVGEHLYACASHRSSAVILLLVRHFTNPSAQVAVLNAVRR